VLDLACGSGRYGRLAQQAGAALIYGVDHSPEMLNAQPRDADWFPTAQAELAALPFAAASFDIVICALAVGHLPRQHFGQALSEIARVTTVGGHAIISDFHPFMALQGGQRAFRRSDGQLAQVEHNIYFSSEYFATMQNALMILEGFAEPLVPSNTLKHQPANQQVPALAVFRFKRQAG
jgi:malonyl-CoA O-methyltransferase